MASKLKDNKGITLVYAMVGVLIVSTFSVLIFSAGMSNLRSLESRKEYQQAYLWVSSAAKTFTEGIEGDYIEIEYPHYTDDDHRGSGTYRYIESGRPNPLSEKFLSRYKQNSTASVSYVMSVECDDVDDSVLSDVSAEVSYSRDDITAVFCLVSNPNNINNYYLTVNIPVSSERLYLLSENPRDNEDDPLEYTAIYRVQYNTSETVIRKGVN